MATRATTTSKRPVGAIVIQRLSPSANELRRKYRNVYAYKKLRDEFCLWIRAGMLNAKIPKATGRRRLIITRCGTRTLDYDNLVGGLKPALDAACREGLIKGDAPHLLSVTYSQACGDLPGSGLRTVLEVWDL